MLNPLYQAQPETATPKAFAPDPQLSKLLLEELKQRSWELTDDDRLSVWLCLMHATYKPKQVRLKECWYFGSAAPQFWADAARLELNHQKYLADWIQGQLDRSIIAPCSDDAGMCANGCCDVDMSAFDALNSLLDEEQEAA